MNQQPCVAEIDIADRATEGWSSDPRLRTEVQGSDGEPVAASRVERFEPTGRRPTMPRVEILDPLRGLAALAVTWFHFTTCSELVKTGWLKASGTYGWLGVEVFFVISGFVVPYSMYCGGYQPRRHFGRFLAKRMIRLEPPYLLSIVLVLALGCVSSFFPGLGGSRPVYSTAQLLLHIGYLNTFFGYEWLNPVYWTLGIEFQYYLLIALVYPLLAARRTAVRVTVIAAMAGLALLVHTPILVFHFLGLFTLGILAFQYHAGLLPRKAFLPAAAFACSVTILSLNLVIGIVGGVTTLVIAFVPMPRHPSTRALVFLGGISYSLYLLHTVIGGKVVKLGSAFGRGLAWELVVLSVAVGVSVVAAAVFNRLVERPAQQQSSRIRYS